MTTSVTLVVATKPQVFLATEVEGAFEFTISNVAGASFHASATAPTATLDVDGFGEFTATVTKNGVSASTTFTIATPQVTFNVPDTLTVTLG